LNCQVRITGKSNIVGVVAFFEFVGDLSKVHDFNENSEEFQEKMNWIETNLIPSHVKLKPYVSDVNFEGVNESKLTVLGTLRQKLLIGDCEIILNFYVVPNSTMKCSCLLGRDFVSHRDLEISFDNLNVQVKKRLPAKNAESFANDIFHIDVVSNNDSFVLDIDSKVPYEHRVLVQDIMKKHYFEPVRPDEPVTQLEMELVVKPNVQPFYFNPRRLSFNEKKYVFPDK
jgi:hypothetical protein